MPGYGVEVSSHHGPSASAGVRATLISVSALMTPMGVLGVFRTIAWHDRPMSTHEPLTQEFPPTTPGHPLTDGRRAGDLAAGDVYDGAVVFSSDRVVYTGGRTFDVLPAGQTGFYWANGVLLASTLH